MSGVWYNMRGLRSRASMFPGDEHGAALSIEKIAAVAVAVLILAALLKMVINQGGAVDKTGSNLAKLVKGEPVTGGGSATGGSGTPPAGANTWVPPGVNGKTPPPVAPNSDPSRKSEPKPAPADDGILGRMKDVAVEEGINSITKKIVDKYAKTLETGGDALGAAQAESLVKVGVPLVSGIKSGIDLLDAERKQKELIQKGDYQGAWKEAGKAAGKFVGDVIVAPIDKLELPFIGKVVTISLVSKALEDAGGTMFDWYYDPMNRVAHALARQPWWPKNRGPRAPLPKLDPPSRNQIGKSNGTPVDGGPQPTPTESNPPCLSLIHESKGIPIYFDPTLPENTRAQAVLRDGKSLMTLVGPGAEVPAGSPDAIAGPDGKYYNPCAVVHEDQHHLDNRVYNGSAPSGQSEINATSAGYRCAKEKGYEGYAREQRNKNTWLGFQRWLGFDIDKVYPKGEGGDSTPICTELPSNRPTPSPDPSGTQDQELVLKNGLPDIAQATAPASLMSQSDDGATQKQIVSAWDVRAAYARTVLEEAGIDSDDSANIASVPFVTHTSGDGAGIAIVGEPTDRYFDAVNERLRAVRGQGDIEARRVLAEIAAEVQAGTFPR